MNKINQVIAQAFLGAALLAQTCFHTTSLAQEGKVNRLTKSERQDGWKLLFNGKNLNRWRNYKKESMGDGWVIKDDCIVWASKGAGDIITKKQYDSFELVLDYKISKGGNSGLMYHVLETENAPWQTGPEIQIQDNVDGHDPQKAGWLYQLYPASTDATKPAGEWNQLRVLITPERCEQYMNGVKYCEYVKGSDDWKQRVDKSKFKVFKDFGKPTKGHICLQDHGNEVAFRNIKIREVK